MVKLVIWILVVIGSINFPTTVTVEEPVVVEEETVTTPYVSPEFLAELEYNSRSNVWN